MGRQGQNNRKTYTDFWAGVEVKGINDCWLWTRSKTGDGYGLITINGIRWHSNRLAYFLYYGIHPGDMKVCHSCDIPECCNPRHLWLGTQKENMQDCSVKNRFNDRKGTNNPRAILSEEDIIQIKKLLYKGIKGAAIGRIYNMPKEHISSIKTGRIWKHI